VIARAYREVNEDVERIEQCRRGSRVFEVLVRVGYCVSQVLVVVM